MYIVNLKLHVHVHVLEACTHVDHTCTCIAKAFLSREVKLKQGAS